MPFETVIAGVGVRGRMDAVFADPDGGWTVVDWKTGSLPDDSRLPALSVQLAAYRLAWAALADCPLERVRAAFHFVRAGRHAQPHRSARRRRAGRSAELGTRPDGVIDPRKIIRRGSPRARRGTPARPARRG